jgi:hypothetical protein
MDTSHLVISTVPPEQPLPGSVPFHLMLRQLLEHFFLGDSDFPEGLAGVFHK